MRERPGPLRRRPRPTRSTFPCDKQQKVERVKDSVRPGDAPIRAPQRSRPRRPGPGSRPIQQPAGTTDRRPRAETWLNRIRTSAEALPFEWQAAGVRRFSYAPAAPEARARR